jgi:hypothetical protein
VCCMFYPSFSVQFDLISKGEGGTVGPLFVFGVLRASGYINWRTNTTTAREFIWASHAVT